MANEVKEKVVRIFPEEAPGDDFTAKIKTIEVKTGKKGVVVKFSFYDTNGELYTIKERFTSLTFTPDKMKFKLDR